MKRLIALIALSASAFALGTQAQAGNAADEPSITVKYSVRELNSERGVAVLYARIEAAAARLCETYQFGHSPAQLNPYHRCVASILGRTIATVDRPDLNAYAAARGVPVGSLSATHSHG
jgi:UrcA family protein